MSVYPLAEARTHLGELVAEARHSHRPVTITEHGKPVVALINVDDLADLEDGLAVARHLADKAAGRVTGTVIRTETDIDAAIDAFEAENA
jgi:prevent-host-death family protein